MNIGDKVWVPSATLERIWEQCPDCLGTKHWHCVLPNGEEFDLECPRCYPGGMEPSTGLIGERYEVTGKATLATINRIELREGGTEYGTDAGCGFKAEELCTDEASAVALSVIRTREYADAEFKRMDEYRRKKGRPKRTADGEHAANGLDCPAGSVNYARSRVRESLKEARRWVDYAARKGAKIDMAAMMAKGS